MLLQDRLPTIRTLLLRHLKVLKGMAQGLLIFQLKVPSLFKGMVQGC